MSFRALISVAVFSLLFPFSQAMANSTVEPQLLAMISTEGAKVLKCDGDVCKAEFSAFCMEPGRPGPTHDAPYLLAKDSAVKLIARSAAGETWQIPTEQAQFTSQRGYAAVRISVPKRLLDELGADSVVAEVGRRVVLLPKRLPSYARTHEPHEIIAALGPNRTVGERIVDNGGERADGARLLSYLINALPDYGKVPAAVRQSLWSATRAAPEAIRDRGEAIARRGFESCLDRPSALRSTMRECLQHIHDRNMWLLNQSYWQTVGSQS